jgi:delta 1-pyrroline-5-carboxylate dehydrogenase
MSHITDEGIDTGSTTGIGGGANAEDDLDRFFENEAEGGGGKKGTGSNGGGRNFVTSKRSTNATSIEDVPEPQARKLKKLVNNYVGLKEKASHLQKLATDQLRPIKDKKKEVEGQILDELGAAKLKKVKVDGMIVCSVSKNTFVKPKKDELIDRVADFIKSNPSAVSAAAAKSNASKKVAEKLFKHVFEENSEIKSTESLRVITEKQQAKNAAASSASGEPNEGNDGQEERSTSSSSGNNLSGHKRGRGNE